MTSETSGSKVVKPSSAKAGINRAADVRAKVKSGLGQLSQKRKNP